MPIGTSEPWIVGFLRRIAFVGRLVLWGAAALWIVLAAILAIGAMSTVTDWSWPARVLLAIGVLIALDLLGGLAFWIVCTFGRGLFWLVTGERLSPIISR
jgi:hypothetical protein